MHVSPGIKEKYRDGSIAAVYSALVEDELAVAVFAISRARRVANVLAITDQRVLTFRRVGADYLLVDSIDGVNIADAFVITNGMKRANAAVFTAMDEVSLGTVLRVSNEELHYINGLLRWITGPHSSEGRAALHEQLVAAGATDGEGAEGADGEGADGEGAQAGADGGGAQAQAADPGTHGSEAAHGTGTDAGSGQDPATAEPDGEAAGNSELAAVAQPGEPAEQEGFDDGAPALKVSDEIVELVRLHAKGVLSADELTAATAALIASIQPGGRAEESAPEHHGSPARVMT